MIKQVTDRMPHGKNVADVSMHGAFVTIQYTTSLHCQDAVNAVVNIDGAPCVSYGDTLILINPQCKKDLVWGPFDAFENMLGTHIQTRLCEVLQWTRRWIHSNDEQRRGIVAEVLLTAGSYENATPYIGFMSRLQECYVGSLDTRRILVQTHACLSEELIDIICRSMNEVTHLKPKSISLASTVRRKQHGTDEYGSDLDSIRGKRVSQPLEITPSDEHDTPKKDSTKERDASDLSLRETKEPDVLPEAVNESYMDIDVGPMNDAVSSPSPHSADASTTKLGRGTPYAYCTESEFREIVRISQTFEADGRIQAVFIKGAVSASDRLKAANILQSAAVETTARRLTNGGLPPKSGIVGFYDYLTNPTQDKCRKTAFTRDNEVRLGAAQRFVERLSRIYQEYAPNEYRLQDRAIPDEVRLFSTVFSTLTVNADFRTALHTDSGDFKLGLGVLTVLAGNYNGLYLGIPALEVAFDIRPGDVLLFNTDLLHGNTEPQPRKRTRQAGEYSTGSGKSIPNSWSRLSCVAYLRTGLYSPTCMSILQQRGTFSLKLDKALVNHETTLNIFDSEHQTPQYLRLSAITKMKPHQLNAVRFLCRRFQADAGALLCLDMGMGKTLITLATCDAVLREEAKRKVLVLCPYSILEHWCQEFRKWRALGIVSFHFIPILSGKCQKEAVTVWNLRGGVLVCGYERFKILCGEPDFADASVARTIYAAILDEGHRLRNSSSEMAQNLQNLGTNRRIILSGTPLQNDLNELHTVLQWVDPKSVPSRSRFEEDFKRPLEEGSRLTASMQQRTLSMNALYILQTRVLNPLWMRLTDVSLPMRRDSVILLRPIGMQKKMVPLMEGTSLQDVHETNKIAAHPLLSMHSSKMMSFLGNSWHQYVQRFAQSAAAAGITKDYDSIPSLCDDSSKLLFVTTLVRYAMSLGEKTLIFSQYIGPLDLIEFALLQLGIPIFRCDGNMTPSQRQIQRERFVEGTVHQAPVMLLSIRAVGVGLDFSCASRVVIFEPTYNPTLELQAIARAHRFGQTRTVYVYRLLLDISSDRRVFELQVGKFALNEMIMNGTSEIVLDQNFENIDSTLLDNDDILKSNQALIVGLVPYMDCFGDVEAFIPESEMANIKALYAQKCSDRVKLSCSKVRYDVSLKSS